MVRVYFNASEADVFGAYPAVDSLSLGGQLRATSTAVTIRSS